MPSFGFASEKIREYRAIVLKCRTFQVSTLLQSALQTQVQYVKTYGKILLIRMRGVFLTLCVRVCVHALAQPFLRLCCASLSIAVPQALKARMFRVASLQIQ